MREILFRGKRISDGEWVEGYLGVEVGGAPVIEYCGTDEDVGDYVEEQFVNPESIGEFTGLTDKNGLAKVFEYDIIDANGRKVGNYYENSDLLKDGTCFLVARMGTKEWSRSEQEAIKRGCKYAE